mmetsp:Transcript_22326/g.72419  ORF Transcript_22326/g.72419 Transcript_22326/m.72419 type:complete len:396 (+) Transcript_22326:1669-2856(+)
MSSSSSPSSSSSEASAAAAVLASSLSDSSASRFRLRCSRFLLRPLRSLYCSYSMSTLRSACARSAISSASDPLRYPAPSSDSSSPERPDMSSESESSAGGRGAGSSAAVTASRPLRPVMVLSEKRSGSRPDVSASSWLPPRAARSFAFCFAFCFSLFSLFFSRSLRARMAAISPMSFSSSASSSSSSEPSPPSPELLSSPDEDPSSSSSSFCAFAIACLSCVRHRSSDLKSTRPSTRRSMHSARISGVVAGWFAISSRMPSSSPSPEAAAPFAPATGTSITLYVPSASAGLSLSKNCTAEHTLMINRPLSSSLYPSRLRFCLSAFGSSTSTIFELPSALISPKRCAGSSSRGSILDGALYPWHTTKISADSLREAAGLVASTLAKSWFIAYISAW